MGTMIVAEVDESSVDTRKTNLNVDIPVRPRKDLNNLISRFEGLNATSPQKAVRSKSPTTPVVSVTAKSLSSKRDDENAMQNGGDSFISENVRTHPESATTLSGLVEINLTGDEPLTETREVEEDLLIEKEPTPKSTSNTALEIPPSSVNVETDPSKSERLSDLSDLSPQVFSEDAQDATEKNVSQEDMNCLSKNHTEENDSSVKQDAPHLNDNIEEESMDMVSLTLDLEPDVHRLPAKEDGNYSQNSLSTAAEFRNVEIGPEKSLSLTDLREVAQEEIPLVDREVKNEFTLKPVDPMTEDDKGKIESSLQEDDTSKEEAMEEISLQQDGEPEARSSEGLQSLQANSEDVSNLQNRATTSAAFESTSQNAVLQSSPSFSSVNEMVQRRVLAEADDEGPVREEIAAIQNDTEEDEASTGHSITLVSEIVEEELEEINLEHDGEPRVQKLEPQANVKDVNSVPNTNEDEDSSSVSSSNSDSSTAGKPAEGSKIEEVQEVDQETTARAPERSAVIRLTRQMSRVLSSMGSMSPRFEIRETKELQELQERVHSLEKELKAKMMDYDILTLTYKEKENQLMNKIECLELANEQLLAGGNDTSIQLQMELTRLQRQNSILSLRERELLFQIGTQEMLSQQMLNRTPNGPVVSSSETKHLEDKITVLESKLAEAVKLSNMYKVQLHDAFDKQKNVQSAALLGLGDGDDVQKELEKLRKQTKEQEVELQDLQDRFFLISVHLAESVAQREELLMKMKRINGYLKH